MRYKIITFGCQFNQSDAERVSSVLENLGYQKASAETEADLILVLACSVRQSAIDRIYGLKQKFEKIKKQKPLITVLSGCVLKSDLPKMKKFFDLIFDIKNLADLPQLLQTISHKPEGAVTSPHLRAGKLQSARHLKISPAYHSNFQAYLPIMTGCNNFCSYCVVPYVRGREVSRPAKDIIKECQELVNRGFKEIILIGQNVNSYHDGKTDFPKLLKIIDALSGDFWLSFATSHPKDMSDELIKVIAKGKHIVPYLHLPVQSGDNEILRKMNRRYTVAHYKSLIKKVRKAVPGIAISTDIIVGFPGETKKQFANTVKLFKEVEFDMAYIAQYSPRVGTVAAKFQDNVPKVEKRRREMVLTDILRKTALENNKKLIGSPRSPHGEAKGEAGKTVEVLVEDYKAGFCFGKTRGFKNIKFTCDINRTGEIVLVEVVDCYAWGLSGELPKVIVILGLTSSGKTKLAVRLAKKFKGEIISADSRQVYIGMDVGTGKDLSEYGKIPYHLIDVISPKKQFTVADWQKLAYEKIEEILKRGKVPIVCGGTGLYISALVEGFTFSETQKHKNTKTREKLNKLNLKKLLTLLRKIDAKTYEAIDKKNRRRVQRALEIYYQTGETKSAQLKKQKPPYDFLLLGLTFPRAVLQKRIEKRLKHRLEKEGMINEIKHLHRQGVSWKRLEEFGLEYRWIAKYLQGKIDKDELFEGLKKAINDFAKRQMTWFKRDKKIQWLRDSQRGEKLAKKFIK